MNLSLQLAKHFREVYFGGNWTSVNLKEVITDISWQDATKKINSFNTILALVYHMNYYVKAVNKVLQGGILEAKDQFSFDHPVVRSKGEWDNLLNIAWSEAQTFAGLVEQLPDSKLWETFSDEKYGNYLRNILGVTEHVHYHLGQIVILKKILSENK